MNSISHPLDEKERVFRETEFLLRLMPGLSAVRRKKRGWDAYGEMVTLQVGSDWKKGTSSIRDRMSLRRTGTASPSHGAC